MLASLHEILSLPKARIIASAFLAPRLALGDYTMTNEAAQKLAPSFLLLPDDGASYKCDVCKEYFSHIEVIKPFTPDGKIHYATCIDCIDEDWMQRAKNCGIAEDSQS